MRELEQNDFKLRRSIVCQKAPKKITEMQKCNRSVKLFFSHNGVDAKEREGRMKMTLKQAYEFRTTTDPVMRRSVTETG